MVSDILKNAKNSRMRLLLIKLINETKNKIRKEKNRRGEKKMKFKMNCECFTNGGNCLASEGKKEREYNKCVFQKNGMNTTNSKKRHICALSSKCRKRLISYGKDGEYFDKKICPQIDKKFDMHLKISNKISKKKEFVL